MVELSELEELASERVQVSELPNEFTATVKGAEIREDTRGRDCLFLTLATDKGDVTFKYTPMHLEVVTKELRRLGINNTDQLIGKKIKLVAKVFRIGNPRHIPVEIEGKI